MTGFYMKCNILLKWFDVICDALCDLVPFAQFKKRGKLPWRSVTLSKIARSECFSCLF